MVTPTPQIRLPLSAALKCALPKRGPSTGPSARPYGIGLCSVEELGWLTGSPNPAREQSESVKPPHPNGSSNGQPKLRDRLCVLIRQYNLDPTQVKAYAADFCGTPTLKDASRDLVESFISHLATSAKENRDGLVCKLNSYAQPVEVKL